MSKCKQKFGQYMTPPLISDFMVELIGHEKNCKILEPSCGDGAFLISLKDHGYSNVDAYEIDEKITNSSFPVKNKSFVTSPLDKYDVIIGNPPYIRWKNLEQNLKSELEASELWNKYCNSLCDYSNIFIIKSIEQLNQNGELIFITPEYWISTTHATNLRNFITKEGYIESIYHFNETPIFKDVNVSLVIFKFVKNKKKKTSLKVVKYFSKKKISEQSIADIKNENPATTEVFFVSQFQENSRWILANENILKTIELYEKKCRKTSSNSPSEYEKLGEYFEIGNGMVSGLDRAFQLDPNANLNEKEKSSILKVVKAKDIDRFIYKKVTNYIFLPQNLSEQTLDKEYPNFCQHLAPFKSDLKKRYNYNKNISYWEWVFLRNFSLFSGPKDRIFVPCKDRISKKTRFRFCYAQSGIFPTQDVTAIFKKNNVAEDLLYVLALLNSKYVFSWLSYKGVRKGDIIEFSEKPVSSIPFRRIDFSNSEEESLHAQIVTAVKEFFLTESPVLLKKIDDLLDKLIF